MSTFPTTKLWAAIAAAASLTLVSPSLAEYPDRPIRVVVPYGPGGVDLQMRAMVPALSKLLGQQVFVENRDGGGATIGTMAVKNAPADGYTLLFTGTSALAVVPQMVKDVAYSADDFSPIGNVTGTPLAIAVRANAPYRTLEELLAFAKANPGKINMGSSGSGTTTHMVGEAFQMEAGVEFTHIPYKGVGAAVQAVMGGFADIVFGVPGAIAPQERAGKLRVLATMGPQRNNFFPDAPTLVEKGIDKTEVTKFGLFAPRATPAAVQQKLVRAVEQVVRSQEFDDTMRKGYTNALYLSPDELAAAVKEEYDYWKKMLQSPRFDSVMNR
ncbi:tripartite tricarboxylate transporter substrate binding protein [uncultured Pigmentiphaga sp.]|uniref:tripartite tricarboxylate transporter substrate binding protein n=1 Tax=uncultured Pigmentiphaga sp. TaxID=340361 RepID=UPI0026300890|nr:tripartite tricarboxylate transporter substrate binding protein [uncultured Pigmentiphaga sp.]